MRKLHIVTVTLLALAISAHSHGQPSNPAFIPVSSNPAGNACTGPAPQLWYLGTYYGCDGTGHYAAVGSGGGTKTYTVLNVTQAPYNAKCDGSTDDTAAIQSALSVSGNIHVLIPYSATSCVISDVLLVHSNTWVDVDPNTTIFEKSGTNTIMLRNTNLSQTISDTNIIVTGGIWDDNWLGNPGVQFGSTSYFVLQSSKISPVTGASGVLGFYGVQWLVVQNATVVNPNIFGIQISQCQDFTVDHIKFVRNQSTISDGVHVNGPSARFLIHDISGDTGDDFVALNAWDWTLSTPNNTEGDITDGFIQTLHPGSIVWGQVKMTTGTSAGVYRVSIDDVKGSSTHAGFIWGSFPDAATPAHTTGTGTIGGIRATNVAMNVTSSTGNYGAPVYLACNVQDVTIDGAVIDGTHLPPTSFPWLRQEIGTTASNIAVGLKTSAATPTSYLFDIFGSINQLSLLPGTSIQGVPASCLSSALVKQENAAGLNVGYIETPNGLSNGGYQAFSAFGGALGTAVTSYTDGCDASTYTNYNAITGDTQNPSLSGNESAWINTATTSDFGSVLSTLTPSSANYTVTGVFSALSNSSSAALYARANSGAATYYIFACGLSSNVGVCNLYKRVAGTYTQLAPNSSVPWVNGQTITLQFVVNGTSLTPYYNGATIAGIGTKTDSDIAAAGQAGWKMNGGSSTTISQFSVK